MTALTANRPADIGPRTRARRRVPRVPKLTLACGNK
jgi:hypothetical protein